MCRRWELEKLQKIFLESLILNLLMSSDLEKNLLKSNPICKKCNKKMKSKGQTQGFQCIRCGKKLLKKSYLKFQEKSKNKCIFQIYLHIDTLQDLYNELEFLTKLSKFDKSLSWFCVYRN